MKVILEIVREELQIPDMNEHEIRFILMDALAEFQSNRVGKHGSARNYVANRYSKDVYPEGERFEQKVKQVERRCIIAEQLRCAIISTDQ